jgi:hypothetical protein
MIEAWPRCLFVAGRLASSHTEVAGAAKVATGEPQHACDASLTLQSTFATGMGKTGKGAAATYSPHTRASWVMCQWRSGVSF